MTDKTNLLELDPEGLTAFFSELGEKPYRATQVIKWIYQQGVTDFSRMTNLSKVLREKLTNTARISLPEIVTEQVSEDGTRKWLIRVDRQNCIETVFIPENDRGTLCISSQVGCPLDCDFCSTAKQGFSRNLGLHEIIGQVWLANEALGHFRAGERLISNIVLMGMGEPLLNYDNVLSAIRLMLSDHAFGLSRKRVTLSTAGVVPGLKKLARDSDVSLAISLHAAHDELRDKLVPINRSYPIVTLMDAIRIFVEHHEGDTITFEYVMLENVNDTIEDARKLAKLLQGLPAKVNLIPFNPFPGAEYKRSTLESINRFREILMNAGIITITRKTRGDDIDAACGQLAGRVVTRAHKFQGNQVGNAV
ncbi:MAG TPA: 23S rRNA (adenine(2503)-C(2))-methyltransferase RlmN [Gammaproteobacteria bacterium]